MTVNLPPAVSPTGEMGMGVGSDTQRVDKHREESGKLLEACRDFEAIFWQQILRQMRRSIPKSGLLDGGTGEEIFQDFLDEEYARTMAGQGAGSLAYMLYEQLRLEEG